MKRPFLTLTIFTITKYRSATDALSRADNVCSLHTHTHTHTHTDTRTHTYTRTHAHTRTHTHTHRVLLLALPYNQTIAPARIHTRAHTNAHTDMEHANIPPSPL